MLLGLICTLTHKFPGTLIILAGVFIYDVVTNFLPLDSRIVTTVILLAITAEVGGRLLRIYLTKGYEISKEFSINSLVAQSGGIVACDALLGPTIGLILWEFIIGKTFLPRVDTISTILFRLACVAFFRFLCGLIMIILILKYLII
ncbi:DUF456 family protein [Methylomusa anaerophila]|nr:DUF456 family protein [Methylomusa anaerophila]